MFGVNTSCLSWLQPIPFLHSVKQNKNLSQFREAHSFHLAHTLLVMSLLKTFYVLFLHLHVSVLDLWDPRYESPTLI